MTTFPNAAGLVEYLRLTPRERDFIEFKENAFSPESIGKYVSGLANSAMYEQEEAAYLIWGINDETRSIVGTKVDITSQKVGNDEFLFWLNKFIRPQINIVYERIAIDGNAVGILRIEPSYRESIRFKADAFIRVGNALQPLSENPERARSIWLNTSRFCFEDSKVSRHLSETEIFEEFRVDDLLDGLRRGGATLSGSGKIEYLVRSGLLVDDNQGGYDVTALLALACAKSLDDFSTLIRKGLRVTEYESSSKLQAKSDTHGRGGYATSFESALALIMSRIPRKEHMDGGIRRTVFEVPEITIRELLANAIIHQDLTQPGDGPLVEIFADKVKITNPGPPLVEIDRFVDTPSRSRNVKLGKVMRDFGLCEERSGGIDRALAGIEDAMLPPPLFHVVGNSTVVTIFMSRSFADMTPDERVRACYQHACLRFELGDPMSNSSLRDRFGLTKRQYPQVSNVIRDAIAAGRIKPRDEDQANRLARYVPYYA